MKTYASLRADTDGDVDIHVNKSFLEADEIERLDMLKDWIDLLVIVYNDELDKLNSPNPRVRVR